MEERRLRKQGRRELSLCAAGGAGDGRDGRHGVGRSFCSPVEALVVV